MPTHTTRLYQDALAAYSLLRGNGPSFLLESSSNSERFGRFSLIGVEPTLMLKGREENCTIELLQPRAALMFHFVQEQFEGFIISQTDTKLVLHIPRSPFTGQEEGRFTRQNIAGVLRALLAKYKQTEKDFAGFYGALSYYFIYQYEDLERLHPEETPDFHLYFFDTLLLFNHLLGECQLFVTRNNPLDAEVKTQVLLAALGADAQATAQLPQVSRMEITPDEETYKAQAAQAVNLCAEGELLELVLSRKISAHITGDSLPLYESYRKLNPAPYLFYFDFQDEVLLGASPEMMVRAEQQRVTLRPISGTIRRGKDAVEEHHLMLELLNSPKEKSELDMLVDLGRNDLARICKPGVQVEDYRIVEKYARVMHTVAQVSGELEPGHMAYDALAACLNAGTLTGAPKLAAMKYIEQIEQHPRGYYGGAVGYLLLNDEVNTGIIIRTAHIKDETLTFLAGATLLVESDPAAELAETRLKASAFLEVLKPYLTDGSAL